MDRRTVKEIKTELTVQHGAIAFTTTAAAQAVVLVGRFRTILSSQPQHSTQLYTLTFLQLLNLTIQTMYHTVTACNTLLCTILSYYYYYYFF